MIAFGVVTYLSVVFGELVPKALTLAHAERLAGLIAPPIDLLSVVLRPVVWVLERSARVVALDGPHPLFADRSTHATRSLLAVAASRVQADAVSQSDEQHDQRLLRGGRVPDQADQKSASGRSNTHPSSGQGIPTADQRATNPQQKASCLKVIPKSSPNGTVQGSV